ncbi:Hint domain-containing protein [Ruegeria sp. HKCCD8929]|uniref:Hint domain-containing protein n=1 Tax=Ruegeria sp. HKCCD8929 TaxID=2683006 RepID=UPI001488BC58
MAILDNAIWLTGAGGTAESGSTVVTDGDESVTVNGTFTGNWDASQGGNNISEFGAFSVTSPITASYDFSQPVENLTFTINHVNDDGGSTYDDSWTIEAFDENGDPISPTDIIAGLTGVDDESVTVVDGKVVIEAEGTNANDITVNIPGQVSQVGLTFGPGPNGSLSGGSGISDLSFDIPPPDADSDGVADNEDLDSDNDGVLNVDEGYSVTPSTITIDFDGDEWAVDDNTRWELLDPDGNVVASDEDIDSGSKTITIRVSDPGEYTFVVRDNFGDGLGGNDPAGYTVTVDGTVVVGPTTNPDFGTSTSHTFDVTPTVTTIDTDGDGIADHLDLDSDNDGITDNVEAQPTSGYVAPTGTDSDGDGLDDAYEGAGDEGLTSVDTDGDGTADVVDTDSDNDGIDDVDEAGHGVTQGAIDASGDADGDGIADAVDDVSGWDFNDTDVTDTGEFTLDDTDNDVASDGSDANPPTSDLNYRDSVPCYTPGTLIMTDRGEVPVEDIRPGDMVLTADNGLQPVKWVGQRTVSEIELARFPNLRPVIIRKNAFGNKRRMRVSPQHGLIAGDHASDHLIRAKHAAEIFGGKFARVDTSRESVTYIHIMFDRHELIYAEGAISESFYPGPMALRSLEDPALDELLCLFPELRSVAFEKGCPSEQYGSPAREYLLRRQARRLRAA